MCAATGMSGEKMPHAGSAARGQPGVTLLALGSRLCPWGERAPLAPRRLAFCNRDETRRDGPGAGRQNIKFTCQLKASFHLFSSLPLSVVAAEAQRKAVHDMACSIFKRSWSKTCPTHVQVVLLIFKKKKISVLSLTVIYMSLKKCFTFFVISACVSDNVPKSCPKAACSCLN